MSETEKAIENLNTAKLILCNPQMITPEMCIRIGQAITDAIELLEEQRELMCGMIVNSNAKCTERAIHFRRLVLCKDCKFGEKSPTFRYYPEITWCNKYSAAHNDEWFCADGERR